MGTDVLLVADADLEPAEALVHALEQRWSRFLPDSELSRLNAAAGPAVVSPQTYEVLALAVDAWRRTAGRFDPTVLAALAGLGYDRSFELVAAVGDVAPRPAPVPGCQDVVLDDDLRLVVRPPGVTFDLGGIAKGHTADLVVDALLAAGATHALADLGGDIRVTGGRAWLIAVADPHHPDRVLATLGLVGGAVATTSRTRRAWTTVDGARHHHVIDPATARAVDRGLAAVTVVAGSAAEAEVLAKAAFVAGPTDAGDLLTAEGATGLLVLDDGTPVHLPGLGEFLA
jgi:thiamine biosynthesis lipoprotein